MFTPRPGGDILNDGLLTASQIATLPLRARLVVLSACNSARYEPSVIDSGIQGLSTSFAIAGVPSMIAALWPVESALARNLIIDTFRTARGGNAAVADAMAMAVRRHLDGPTPRPLLHPRFWAALVVLGDGSIGLNASAQVAKRELGPFANVDAAERASILSAASLDTDFVSSARGHWTGKGFESSIRREASDGTVRWEVKDPEIGAGPVAASKQTVYAGGYLNQQATPLSPILRGLQPDGKILWTLRPANTPEDSTVMGLAIAQDQSAVALVGPIARQKAETDFSLLRLDGSGREIARKSLGACGLRPGTQFRLSAPGRRCRPCRRQSRTVGKVRARCLSGGTDSAMQRDAGKATPRTSSSSTPRRSTSASASGSIGSGSNPPSWRTMGGLSLATPGTPAAPRYMRRLTS